MNKNVVYFEKGKKKEVVAKICSSVWCKFWGLMFRKNSPPLLFVFDKEQNITIHSLFCKSFEAIWLDKKFRVTKKERIEKVKLSTGRGKYLLEIPYAARFFRREKEKGLNRKTNS